MVRKMGQVVTYKTLAVWLAAFLATEVTIGIALVNWHVSQPHAGSVSRDEAERIVDHIVRLEGKIEDMDDKFDALVVALIKGEVAK